MLENEDKDVSLVALDFEGIEKLIRDKHGVSLSKDDPTLYIVTIMNVFNEHYQKMLEAHNAAITKIMSLATQQTIKTIQDEARIFTEDFKQASIANTVAKVSEHQASMSRFLTILEDKIQSVQNAKSFNLMVLAGNGALFLLNIGILLWKGF